MKFQVKALVAALAVVASVPAQAAMDLTTTGSGSMVLAVFDSVAGVSAAFDLGKNYSDFSIIGASFADSNVDAVGTSFSWNLTQGDYATAWSTFLPLVNPANLQWAVLGGDNVGSGVGNRGIIGTLNQETVASITTPSLITQLGALNSYMTGAPVASTQIVTNHNAVANGANVSNSTSASANFLTLLSSGKTNGAGSVVVGNIGDSMAVYQQVTGSTVGFATGSVFANNAAFRLDANGTLEYVVAVPEADSWAMMLLGLGFMGFAARRKQA